MARQHVHLVYRQRVAAVCEESRDGAKTAIYIGAKCLRGGDEQPVPQRKMTMLVMRAITPFAYNSSIGRVNTLKFLC
jgi:hypothetical protein